MVLNRTASPRLNGLLVLYVAAAVLCVVVDYVQLAKFYVVRQGGVLGPQLEDPARVFDVAAVLGFLALLVTIAVIVRKRRVRVHDTVRFPRFERGDWAAILVIAVVTLLRLPVPDSSWDTLQYHVYLQDFKFENAITYHFFPGSSNTFLFPLGDRLFGVTRLLFGYRGGVLLSSLVWLILYFQLKELIPLFPGLRRLQENRASLALSALFVLSTEAILANIGIYMIDLLLVPFLLELVRLVLSAGATSPRWLLPYSALLAGLSIAIKLSAIVFCAWLGATLMYRFRKHITLGLAIASLTFLLVPVAVYAMFSWTQTGNPVFPFANTVFRSPYFPARDFNVSLWTSGPKTFLEFLFWPIFIVFQPQRQFWIFPYDSGRVSLGFAIAIAYLCVGLIRRSAIPAAVGLCMVGAVYSWIYVLNGEKRYGLILELASGMLIIGLYASLVDLRARILERRRKAFQLSLVGPPSSRRRRLLGWYQAIDDFDRKGGRYASLLCMLLIVTMLVQVLYAYDVSIVKNVYDYSSRGPILSDPDNYFRQFSMIGKDYRPLEARPVPLGNAPHISLNAIEAWIVLPVDLELGAGPSSGYASLLNKNVPLVYIGYAGTNRASLNAFMDLKERTNLSAKRLYSVSALSMDVLQEQVDKNGLSIINAYQIQPTFLPYPLRLVEVALQ